MRENKIIITYNYNSRLLWLSIIFQFERPKYFQLFLILFLGQLINYPVYKPTPLGLTCRCHCGTGRWIVVLISPVTRQLTAESDFADTLTARPTPAPPQARMVSHGSLIVLANWKRTTTINYNWFKQEKPISTHSSLTLESNPLDPFRTPQSSIGCTEDCCCSTPMSHSSPIGRESPENIDKHIRLENKLLCFVWNITNTFQDIDQGIHIWRWVDGYNR